MYSQTTAKVTVYQNVLRCSVFWVPGGETGIFILTDLPPVASSNFSSTRVFPGCCLLQRFRNQQILLFRVEPLSKNGEKRFRGFLFYFILLSFQSVFELRSYDYFLSPHQSAEFVLAKSNFPGRLHPPAIHSLKNACSSPQFCSKTITRL